ncbi:Peroxisomal bifunctional enzyme [Lamellibrachia satsuma]|nr:Peroxisomal bifunctional enzyme [Lamellibrachia satsuma]
MVLYRLDGNVAILEVNNPPVNALSTSARRAMEAALKRAAADPACQCVVLSGSGGKFISGADIKELQDGAYKQEPDILSLCDQIETSKKPVVAAIQGYALGGGFVIATSSHYRVCHPKARFGFPEVHFGIFPAASGTQRFPRLAGVEAAMDLMTTGRQIGVEEARNIGIIDRVCFGDFMREVVAFARTVADQPLDNRRSSKRTVPDAQKAKQFYHAALKRIESRMKGQKAPLYCLKAIMAAVTEPYSEGLRTEKSYALMLINSSEAKALQYAFFSQRAAPKWRLPGGASSHTASPKEIKTAAVIGAGTMGTGITMAILNAGIHVTLLEQNQKLLDRGVAAIRSFYGGSVRLGKMTSGQMKDILTRLSPSLRYDDVKNADIVIECVFEDMAIKKQVFATLDRVCKPDAFLCSNTSSLNIDEMASVTRRPSQVMGVHFFTPANIMTVLENVRGTATSPRTVATAMNFGSKIGKVPVLVGNCPRFVANRLGMTYMSESMFLVEEGASPHQVDQVLEDFGMTLGGHKTMDLAGVDIQVKIMLAQIQGQGHTANRNTQEVAGERFCPLSLRLVEAGRLGRKIGRGWYKYDRPGSRVSHIDNEVTDLILDYCQEMGIQRRQISPQEIRERVVFSVINEGFKVLEEGIADKASDIDVLMLLGYGWPRQTGGPMYYASQLGLRHVLQKVALYRSKYPRTSYWRPANLLKRLAENDVPMPTAQAPVQSKDRNCVLCGRSHSLESCGHFHKMKLAERKVFPRKKIFCCGCKDERHLSRTLSKRKECQTCGGLHPTLRIMMTDRRKPQNQTPRCLHTALRPVLRVSLSHETDSDNVACHYNSLIVSVMLYHKDAPDESIMVYALLDDQSNSTFIAQQTMDKLKATGQPVKIKLATMLTEETINSEVVHRLSVCNVSKGTPIPLPGAYLRESIPANRSLIPRPETAMQWRHLASVAEQLLPCEENIEIGLLIGLDCPRAIKPRELKPGTGDDPWAVRTSLGWGIAGIVDPSQESGGLMVRVHACRSRRRWFDSTSAVSKLGQFRSPTLPVFFGRDIKSRWSRLLR